MAWLGTGPLFNPLIAIGFARVLGRVLEELTVYLGGSCGTSSWDH